MTDPNRRIDDRLPTEPLDWEDPEVKHARESTRLANAMAEAGAAFLAHMDVGGVIAQIPNTDQYVVAGTLAMIGKVMPGEQPSTAGAARQGGNTSLEGLTNHLHNAIMNLPAKHADDYYATTNLAYKCGHRDARHDAAELAIAHDATSPIPPLTAPAPLTDTDLDVIEEAAQVLESGAKHNRENGRTVLAHAQQTRADRLRAIATKAAPQQSEMSADEIVTSLYRRFKDWSKRGFGPDDVTWCEVKAEVLALIAKAAPAAPVQTAEPLKCSVCFGTGIVDDGEIDCYPNGTPYENGPIKCVKDCPACANEAASKAAPVQAEQAQAEPIYQASMRGGWDDVEKWQFDLHNEKGDGSIKTRIVYTTSALPAQAEQVAAVRAAYEQAAKCVDTFVSEQLDPERMECGRDIAAAIRALRTPSTGEASKGGE